MKLSRDSVLALQRHFLGALRAPARTWLEPLPSPPLVFRGDALRSGTLDLGSVSSPGEERCVVRICNRSAERVDVRIGAAPAWLTARWLGVDGDTAPVGCGDSGVTLEIRVIHDDEREFRGTLPFVLGNRVEELNVRMAARRLHPVAQFDFHGSPVPQPVDFGAGDGSYRLSVMNATSVPLVVTFSDLPPGLTFEIDGRSRSGPIAGPFFERTAPFAVDLHPQLFGLPGGVIRLHTNDPRPELQDMELRFEPFPRAPRARMRAVPPRSPSRVRPEAVVVLIGLLFLLLLFVVARGF